MFEVILKHAPKYLSGSFFSAVVGMLMLKYYTYVFDPVSFGVLSLYLVMFKYVTTIVSLNLDSASTRFYFDYRLDRRDEYLSTIFWFITFISFIVFIVALFFMDSISNWIATNTKWIYLLTLISAIVAVYVSFLMRILYNEQKSISVLKHTILQTLINHTASVVFILKLGILGRIGGLGLGYLWNFATLLKEFANEQLFRLKFVFNIAMVRETLLLSLPSIIASVQTVLFVYLDRIFIKHYLGDGLVGIYTLGYILGQGLSMIYEAITQAVLPKVYSGLKENYESSIIELERFSYIYYSGLLIVTLLISGLAPVIVNLLSNKSYAQASSVMPFIMAGFMMGGFYKIPSLILGFHKVVWFYPFLAFVSFGTNALLNWWLIPNYGIVGASFASFAGLFIYSAIMQYISKKYVSNHYIIFVCIIYLTVFTIALGAFYG